jgi:hypothetical protein
VLLVRAARPRRRLTRHGRPGWGVPAGLQRSARSCKTTPRAAATGRPRAIPPRFQPSPRHPCAKAQPAPSP